MSQQIPNIHQDHRKRLKARFLSQGLSNFDSHEILELLLCYALPRCDTNPIGHELLKRFGSLSAVFDAPIDQLCKVEGISEHSAILIKLIPQLAREYISDMNTEKETFSDYDKAGRYFISKFIGSVKEEVYVALFDNGMHMIDCMMLNEGEVNSSQVSIRSIVSFALNKNASFVMLAHNHPHGTIIPSSDDLTTTRACETALGIVGIKLSEHYIISGNRYMGILHMCSSTENEPSKSHDSLKYTETKT